MTNEEKMLHTISALGSINRIHVLIPQAKMTFPLTPHTLDGRPVVILKDTIHEIEFSEPNSYGNRMPLLGESTGLHDYTSIPTYPLFAGLRCDPETSKFNIPEANPQDRPCPQKKN